MLTAEGLVAGPRGRRLALAFAQASERAADGPDARLPLGTAVFDASYRLAVEHGHAVMRFGGSEEPRSGENTPGEVAVRLGEVPLVPADPSLLLEALGASVASAMYWQEPDGEDLVCAVPAVREALLRVTEHLVGFPAVQRWAAPLDATDQWQVDWDDAPTPSRPELAAWRVETLAEESVARRTRPADPRANWSGQWWSHPPSGLPTSTGSSGVAGPYGLWLVEDFHGWPSGTVSHLRVRPGARVLELDGPLAWAALCREFPLDVTAGRRHDWFRVTGRSGPWVVPDWSLVAERYDGVHLGIGGYLAAATTAVEVDGAASVIAGWNPDATWWLTEAVHPVGQHRRWRANRDDRMRWSPE